MYYNFSENELRSICKTYLESFEKWARLVIHEILTDNIGSNYFYHSNNGVNLFKKELIENVEKRRSKDSLRYKKPVDALLLDDIIYILCKPELYKKYFSPFLISMYPNGKEEVRTFLSRLIPIRNKLSHSNNLSIRESEQCVCYCNDFIECVKEYFKMTNKNKTFNVPTIIKAIDSLGNEYILSKETVVQHITILGVSDNSMKKFSLGEKFSIEITTDPSFEDSEFTLKWKNINGVEVLNNGKKVNITISNELIGIRSIVNCILTSKNEWHRESNAYDQNVMFTFSALP
ncbi:hypothetical protein [uncultured Polaribacter sp.]|uniref:hypothetical protein n=1 Tax=uncultured Polaribacter sp. TaxID=174711 RepID=UPI00261671B4|nr:hypothetical protein [uncultured Polaribacter sp.]